MDDLVHVECSKFSKRASFGFLRLTSGNYVPRKLNMIVGLRYLTPYSEIHKLTSPGKVEQTGWETMPFCLK
jgi:hypothetical protein